MSVIPPVAPESGKDARYYIEQLWQHVRTLGLVVGHPALLISRGVGGTMLTLCATEIDLGGVLWGPFYPSAGKYFVVVDLGGGSCTQKPAGTVRPSPVPQGEVWIDLRKTVGRVYFPRVG